MKPKMNKTIDKKILKVVCSYCDFKLVVSEWDKDIYEEASRMIKCPKCGKYPALQFIYK
jgi:DNA-directed RNA polymerase subunit RPC12/RpoP